MPISLHAAIVPTWIQTLGGLVTVLDKAAAHCEAHGIDPGSLADLRLAPDMFDFAYQVKATWAHSLDALAGAREGAFIPGGEPPRDLGAMRDRVAETVAALERVDAAELEDIVGKPVELRFQNFTLPFATAEDFLLSFAQPNFFFHLTMAYAVLRNFGVEIGKPDYMGKLRANF